jgi:DNA modification methylase
VRERHRAPVPNSDPALNEAIASFAPQIIQLKLSELKPSPRNARTHSPKQIHQIAESIKAFGFTNPVAVNSLNEIISGHGRCEAAKLLGMTQVPAIRLDYLDSKQARLLRIADNRLAELAGWDDEILKLELGELIEFDAEIALTGFELGEIDVILDGSAPTKVKDDPADALPEFAEVAVTQRGDIWLLGKHRLMCGDARDPTDYARLLEGEKAQAVFTDPPYNLAASKIGGLGKIQHREFAMAVGEMSQEGFTAFLREVFGQIAANVQNGGLIYSCIDAPHLYEMLTAGNAVFDELKGIITWAKTNAGMGSFYRSQTEFVTFWKVGKAPHINNVELGKHGRYRTTLWSYAGVNGFRKGRMEELSSHPTVKPCAMVMEAIKDCSKPGGIVLDPFMGSGTTLIAAAKTKRRGYGLELDPLYVDGAIRRWESLFKEEACHAETGLTFTEMAVLRSGAAAAAGASLETVGGGHVA